MTQTHDLTWPQGEDLAISLIYKEGTTTLDAVVVDLSTGYELRMDIVTPDTKQRVYTFNTAPLDELTDGVSDTNIEGVLSSGAGGTPNINILVPRGVTLPGGAIYSKLTTTPPTTFFNYDVFLRNVAANKQAKVLQGTIIVEESYTLWR